MLICVTVAALQNAAMPIPDTLHESGFGLNVEASGSANRYPSDVFPGFFSFRNLRDNLVAGSESENPFLPGKVSAWKSVIVDSRAAIGAASSCFDRQCRALPSNNSNHVADASSVQSVAFRKA